MKTTIEKINYDTLENLIPNEKYWNKILETKDTFQVNLIKKHKAIVLKCENGADLILDITPQIRTNEKSKYARFIKKYGEPIIDLELETDDKDGDYPFVVLD